MLLGNLLQYGLDRLPGRPGRTPVAVYQMGRVASRTVLWSLRQAGVRPVYHLHWFVPPRLRRVESVPGPDEVRDAVRREIGVVSEAYEFLGAGTRWKHRMSERLICGPLRRELLEGSRPVRFVVLIREPISRNLSTLYRRILQRHGSWEGLGVDTERGMRRLFQRYLTSWPLTWFDRELHAMVGIDAFERPFDRQRGYDIYEQGHRSALVIQSELPDAIKEAAIGDFCGIPDFRLERPTLRKEDGTVEGYRRFLDEVVLPDWFVEQMRSSRYARHFYDEVQLSRVVASWSGRTVSREEVLSANANATPAP